ncbi:hypothetical protein VTI74DRAFT_1804 [Chaetomium olivicolor]
MLTCATPPQPPIMGGFHIPSMLLAGAAAAVTGFRVDTHFHALPPAYQSAVAAAGGDPSRASFPDWSPEDAIKSLNLAETSLGILSVYAPGVSIAGTGDEARALACTLNQNLSNYSTDAKYRGRLGFLGVLPDWRDVDGTLTELGYLYKERKLCAGVAERLQHYKALVFLHPTALNVNPKFIAGEWPQPMLDYP